MLKKRKLLAAAFLSALLIAAWAVAAKFSASFALVIEPGYGVDVPAQEVEWIELPKEVNLASHWSNRHQSHIDFRIPEDAFLQMFSAKTFKEILTMNYSILEEVVDPKDPKFAERIADSGLVYNEEWDNGGGIRITFDRSAEIATYSYVGW